MADGTVGRPTPFQLLAAELDDYQRLLIAWDEAQAANAADPPGQALTALARHVDQKRLRQLRGLFCPSGLYEALALVPLPGLDLLPDPAPWTVPGLGLWQAMVSYRRQLDQLLALYDGLGTRSLGLLKTTLRGQTVRSPAELYGLWQRCVDACEADVVRASDYPERLAAVAAAGARLRAEQRQWAAQWLGIDSGGKAQQALSDEIAAIRRQLRLLAQSAQ